MGRPSFKSWLRAGRSRTCHSSNKRGGNCSTSRQSARFQGKYGDRVCSQTCSLTFMELFIVAYTGEIGTRNGKINGRMRVMLRVSRQLCWTSSRFVSSIFICDISDCPQTCHSLHTDLMKSIAVGLNLKESFFDDKVNKQCHNLRLLSYPPIKRSLLEADGQARAGAHSGKPGWWYY
jgi:hypothetical protein